MQISNPNWQLEAIAGRRVAQTTRFHSKSPHTEIHQQREIGASV